MREYEINGVTLCVPEDLLRPKIASKLSSGAYEAHEASAVLQRLKKGQRVLELGSGLGYIAVLSAKIAGAPNIITVEANPKMLPIIRNNLDRNDCHEVELIHGAVTRTKNPASKIQFEQKGAFWASRLADETSDPDAVLHVPLLQLDNLLARHRPGFVIMDIEGAEAYLFERKWPRYVKSVVIELHPRHYPDRVIKKIVDCMSASGLTYDPGPSRGRVIGFRRLRH